jgi:hypothetical protein
VDVKDTDRGTTAASVGMHAGEGAADGPLDGVVRARGPARTTGRHVSWGLQGIAGRGASWGRRGLGGRTTSGGVAARTPRAAWRAL